MKPYFYRNLKTGTWSRMESGLVVDHPEIARVRDAEFRVRPGGRADVIEKQRKNVHAFVIGDAVDNKDDRDVFFRNAAKSVYGPCHRVAYDPYKAGHFVSEDTGEEVRSARMVLLTREGKARAWGINWNE